MQNEGETGLSRRDLLSLVGSVAGSAAMYHAMTELDYAEGSAFTGPIKLSPPPADTSGEQRDRFRRLPAVRAALDAVPDPANGLLVNPERGGGPGSRIPRRPHPLPMSGAGALPEPHEDQSIRLAAAIPAVISAAC